MNLLTDVVFLYLREVGQHRRNCQEDSKKQMNMTCSNGRAAAVYFGDQAMMAISATTLRLDIAQGCTPDELLPPGVWEYVRQRGLYLT